MAPTRGPGKRAGLTRQAICRVADELIREEGIAALTMRALAVRLGVTPNSLYSHVVDKTDLLDALLDDALGSIEAKSSHRDPKAALATIMNSTYEVLLARSALVPLYLERKGARGPNATRLGALMDEELRRLGVDPGDIESARSTLIVHAIGAAAFETSGAGHTGATQVPTRQAAKNFATSIQWLLTGIASAAPIKND